MKRKATTREAGSKPELTIRVRPKYVAMLRKASAQRGRTITELVEEMAEQLNESGTTKELWADRMNGRFAGGFTDADYQRNDMLGALLRKNVSRKK